MLLSLICLLASVGFASAQDLQSLLQTHEAEVVKPSRKSVGVLLDDLVASGLPQVPAFLEQWAERNVWQDDTSGLFYFGDEADDTLALRDIDTGEEATAPSDGFSQLRPNGGVRRSSARPWCSFNCPIPILRAAALRLKASRAAAMPASLARSWPHLMERMIPPCAPGRRNWPIS